MNAAKTIPIEFQARKLADDLQHAPEGRLRTSHTETIWKYRPYQGGEPAVRIDWKQCARSRELLVREHEKIVHRDVYFWASFLDCEPEMQDRAKLIMLALAHILVRKERRIGWLRTERPMTQTARRVDGMMNFGLKTAQEAAPPPLATTHVVHQLVVIAARLETSGIELLEALRRLAGRDNRGIILNLDGVEPSASHPIALVARNAAWPIVPVRLADRPDLTLTQLLEKTVMATR